MVVSLIPLRAAVLLGLGLLVANAGLLAAEIETPTPKTKPRPELVRPETVKKPIRLAPRESESQQSATPAESAAPAEPACTDCTDLTIGPCEVQCFKNTTYSTELCNRVGYRSDLTFRAMPTAALRNIGPRAVTFPAGTRLWTIEGQDPAAGKSPATGLYLTAGAEVPGPSRPVKVVQQAGLGEHRVRFVIDPDNLVAETDESNNTSECRWTVVAPTEPLQPDLALMSVVVEPARGGHATTFQHRVTVSNIGNDDNSGYHVRCTPGSAWNQPSLAPGASHTQTYPIPNVSTLPPGAHTVTCTVAPFSAEANTTNNSASASFTIEAD